MSPQNLHKVSGHSFWKISWGLHIAPAFLLHFLHNFLDQLMKFWKDQKLDLFWTTFSSQIATNDEQKKHSQRHRNKAKFASHFYLQNAANWLSTTMIPKANATHEFSNVKCMLFNAKTLMSQTGTKCKLFQCCKLDFAKPLSVSACFLQCTPSVDEAQKQRWEQSQWPCHLEIWVESQLKSMVRATVARSESQQ